MSYERDVTFQVDTLNLTGDVVDGGRTEESRLPALSEAVKSKYSSTSAESSGIRIFYRPKF